MSYRTAELRGIIARARPDGSLFDAALRGDPVAFAEIYRRYHGRVYAFCLSRLMDPQLAEDAAQETFVRFLHAEPEAVANPRAWLFSVARNVSIDVVRTRSRVDASADITDRDEALIGSAVDSGEALLAKEQGRAIMLAIRRLRPRYRTALILRELHGLSSVEIGESLGMTPGAVDTLVSRARDAFGVAYAEVSDLPEACRTAFPLIYKRHGSGLDEAEESVLEAHLAGCARCRAEAGRAAKPERLAGAVPLLLPLGLKGAHGGLAQVLAQFDPSLASMPTVATTAAPTLQSVLPKVAAVALAASVVAAPAAKSVVERRVTFDPTTGRIERVLRADPGSTGGRSSTAERGGANGSPSGRDPRGTQAAASTDATRGPGSVETTGALVAAAGAGKGMMLASAGPGGIGQQPGGVNATAGDGVGSTGDGADAGAAAGGDKKPAAKKPASAKKPAAKKKPSAKKKPVAKKPARKKTAKKRARRTPTTQLPRQTTQSTTGQQDAGPPQDTGTPAVTQ